MKSYRSIAQNKGEPGREFTAHVFDKLDGTNLHFEWSRKNGWRRFGTRARLLDKTHPIFGKAMDLFRSTLGEDIAKIATAQGWQELVAFAEFWGDNSFAGRHNPDDTKRLTLFDVAPYKQGILGPEDFLRLFGHLAIPKYLGIHTWNAAFVQDVYEGKLSGVTFEGVVGKAGKSHQLVMAKVKTRAWVEKVQAFLSPEEAQQLIDS